MRRAAAVLSALFALAVAPAAQAGTTASENWAGYAAHGTTFDQVSAHWRQPHAACTPGERTFSAMWVGLGGYSLSSTRLEQVGTELDCTYQGQSRSSAWYELVPGPSRTIAGLHVRPGDALSASVDHSTAGVVLSIEDLRTHYLFRKTFHPSGVDITSAEWILEAPSACSFGGIACETPPLTDFGEARFWVARAQTTRGTTGPVSSSAWWRTKIVLTSSGQQFIGNRPNGTSLGTATPSALNPAGGAFTVTYRASHGTRRAFFARTRLPAGPTYLRH